ncbi:eukaryotic translation initiation factor 4E type 3-like [Planoprotostelium fungivorum]|uniref:Eukaryotic translation initiation factor 4E type 3-like n=1 Tax=Planoprotostelium fungivorum TaxID=1890364 RepID=A0A2P6NYZ1_9EUKA|nr:eukaryotic translation initiation factor 4E type 3-like [Planoprotostelium fungivorum]
MMILAAPQPVPSGFIPEPFKAPRLPDRPRPRKTSPKRRQSPPPRNEESVIARSPPPRTPSPTLEEEKKRVEELTKYALENEWAFWYDKYPGPGLSFQEYKASLRLLGSFDCIPDFWRWFNNMAKPTELGPRSSLHLMKHGIYPLWEDPSNYNGGEVVIHIDRGDTSIAWQTVLIAVIGEQFSNIIMSGDDICGVSVNVRKNESCISVWNKSIKDMNINAVEIVLRNLLKGIRIRQFIEMRSQKLLIRICKYGLSFLGKRKMAGALFLARLGMLLVLSFHWNLTDTLSAELRVLMVSSVTVCHRNEPREGVRRANVPDTPEPVIVRSTARVEDWQDVNENTLHFYSRGASDNCLQSRSTSTIEASIGLIFRRSNMRSVFIFCLIACTLALKNDWEFCSVSSECTSTCCSKQYSDDGKLKCTPTPGSSQCVQGSSRTVAPVNDVDVPTFLRSSYNKIGLQRPDAGSDSDYFRSCGKTAGPDGQQCLWFNVRSDQHTGDGHDGEPGRPRVEILIYDYTAKDGETWNYQWNFYIPSNFPVTSDWCHVHQLIADGGPALTHSIRQNGYGVESKVLPQGSGSAQSYATIDNSKIFGQWVSVNQTVTFGKRFKIIMKTGSTTLANVDQTYNPGTSTKYQFKMGTYNDNGDFGTRAVAFTLPKIRKFCKTLMLDVTLMASTISTTSETRKRKVLRPLSSQSADDVRFGGNPNLSSWKEKIRQTNMMDTDLAHHVWSMSKGQLSDSKTEQQIDALNLSELKDLLDALVTTKRMDTSTVELLCKQRTLDLSSIIDARGWKMSNQSLQRISSLDSVLSLNLSGCQLFDSVSIRFLNGMKHLRKLDLSRTKVDDDGLKKLNDLSGCNVTDSSTSCISNFNLLEELNLSKTRITDDTITHLCALDARTQSSRLPRLQKLWLASTRVTNRSLSLHLHKLKDLVYINLLSCSVDESGMEKFKAVVQKIDHVRTTARCEIFITRTKKVYPTPLPPCHHLWSSDVIRHFLEDNSQTHKFDSKPFDTSLDSIFAPIPGTPCTPHSENVDPNPRSKSSAIRTPAGSGVRMTSVRSDRSTPVKIHSARLRPTSPIPLHLSPFGKKAGKKKGAYDMSSSEEEELLRVVDRPIEKAKKRENRERMEQTFQIVKEHVESMAVLQEKGILPQKVALQPAKTVERQSDRNDTPTGVVDESRPWWATFDDSIPVKTHPTRSDPRPLDDTIIVIDSDTSSDAPIDADAIIIIDDDSSDSEDIEDTQIADSQIQDTPPTTQTPPTQTPPSSQGEKILRCFRISIDISSSRMPKRPRPEDIDRHYSKRCCVSEPLMRTMSSFSEGTREPPESPYVLRSKLGQRTRSDVVPTTRRHESDVTSPPVRRTLSLGLSPQRLSPYRVTRPLFTPSPQKQSPSYFSPIKRSHKPNGFVPPRELRSCVRVRLYHRRTQKVGPKLFGRKKKVWCRDQNEILIVD